MTETTEMTEMTEMTQNNDYENGTALSGLVIAHTVCTIGYDSHSVLSPTKHDSSGSI